MSYGTAIYFHSDAYNTSGAKLMGRNAAGASFLSGFFKHSKCDNFWFQIQDEAEIHALKQLAVKNGRTEEVFGFNHAGISQLSKIGMMYYPGPNIGHQAYLRSFFGHSSWSLCGITHTTSSSGAMDAICELITAPIQPWDAVICTSNAVKRNVEIVLQAQVDYLKDRLGITNLILPQLPVIPLGIDTNSFLFSADIKTKSRQLLNISNDEIVVLYVGRLSFHAKAHPLPMYKAINEAALEASKSVVLIECGWFANDHIRDSFKQGADVLCPNIRTICLDGRDEAQRTYAWSAADIFCSLSDNIQETFGITPIEAMAAGLPVIVSDWDGYKDTVRDGIDGFRINTMMPQAGLGGDLAARHALGIDTYDMYCGHSSAFISVEAKKAKAAFMNLFQSKETRLAMGHAGRRQAQMLFDWSVIIPAYEALWFELNNIRVRNSDKKINTSWPARLDPFSSFSHYATEALKPDTQIKIARNMSNNIEDFKVLNSLVMVNYVNQVLPSISEVELILTRLATGSMSALEAVDNISPERKAIALRGLSWLIKIGLIEKYHG